jgi:DNA-binding transcriptional MerR regulator
VVTMQDKHWKVGELATQTGLTVRTLHHYDEIGLLVPSGRSPSGHRLYGEQDVARLYRIVALRQIGLSLDDVKATLEQGSDPRETLRRQLDELERRIELHQQLRHRVTGLLAALERSDSPSAENFIEVLEVITRMEKYYTPEQLTQLEERRNELGDDAIRSAEQEWADLIAKAEEHMAKGTDPAAPEVQAIAKRWQELIEAFTGGDPGIRASLQKMYEEEGPEKASRGMVNPELMAYIARAQK